MQVCFERSYVECAIDLAVLQKVPPLNRLLVLVITFGIFGEIQLARAQRYPLGLGPRMILLDDLEEDLCMLKQSVPIRCHAELQCLFVIPSNFMVFYRCPMCLAAVLSSGGMWEMPLHERHAGYERHVVEVKNLVNDKIACSQRTLRTLPPKLARIWAAMLSILHVGSVGISPCDFLELRRK